MPAGDFKQLLKKILFIYNDHKTSYICSLFVSNPCFSSHRHFTYNETHVEGPASIAQAVAEAGVAKRLIHVSALNADEESESECLQAKVDHLY